MGVSPHGQLVGLLAIGDGVDKTPPWVEDSLSVSGIGHTEQAFRLVDTGKKVSSAPTPPGPRY